MIEHQHPQPSSPARTPAPVASYRLQLGPSCDFAAAAGVVPYLAALGVSDAYLSPVFAAREGSEHGYDVCDHTRLSPELGGEAGFAQLERALTAHGMGALLDVVPNHMGNDPATNRWWRDVLENGPSSPYSDYFDIDWDPVKPELKDKVLLPILGDQYGTVLERGDLRLEIADGALELRYFDHRLPLNPRQTPIVYAQNLDGLRAALGDQDPNVRELLSVITALHNLPPYVAREAERVAERQREKEIARERLARLIERSEDVRGHIARCLAHFNGQRGAPASYAPLHGLLERQAYRLAYWRTAFDEINYRRFFDVNELAALRTEHPAVFAETHGLVFRLVRQGVVRGLRVDHPDGLFEPGQYFARLRAATTVPPSGGSRGESIYLVAEKILTRAESLPADWPIEGTTGYGFLNAVNGLFVDAGGLDRLRRIHARFTGERAPFADVAYACKKDIMLTSLASELNVLAHALNRLSETSWRTRDFTLNSCRAALLEFIACLPVYRTYVTAQGGSEADRAAIERAVALARLRNPVMERTIFEFLEGVVLPAGGGGREGVRATVREAALEFAMKLQQYTGPVQAKGIEDTAFYRYNVLTSLNEVGGDPGRGEVGPDEFHQQNRRRFRERPLEMIATSTHDAKRGEDVRARLDALSEMPEAWRRVVGQWTRLNASHRRAVAGRPAPSRNDEYLFYQSLLGVWPPGPMSSHSVPEDLISRLTEYMVKAVREAKVHSSWVNVDAEYERAVTGFVRGVLASATTPKFLDSFQPFAQTVARAGMVNSLAQLVLKIASPGVADFYQGTELWELQLVDPDNRRAVDFARRRAMLDDLREPLAWVKRVIERGAVPAPGAVPNPVDRLLAEWPDGRVKLYLTACGIMLRRLRPALLLSGSYVPLACSGPVQDHLVAFARRHGDEVLIAVVPRLTQSVLRPGDHLPLGAGTWGPARVDLPPDLHVRRYHNLFTGDLVDRSHGPAGLLAADVLKRCPVALLLGRADGESARRGKVAAGAEP